MADISKIEELWDDNPIDVSAEVNFIWSIANKLRGPYRSDKYKDVIIPMVIIRRFECALKGTRHAVADQYEKVPAYPAKTMYKISGYQFYNRKRLENKAFLRVVSSFPALGFFRFRVLAAWQKQGLS